MDAEARNKDFGLNGNGKCDSHRVNFTLGSNRFCPRPEVPSALAGRILALAKQQKRGHRKIGLDSSEVAQLNRLLIESHGLEPLSGGEISGVQQGVLAVFWSTDSEKLAPRTDNDFLTLALCKRQIRNELEPYEFCLGIASKGIGRNDKYLYEENDFIFLWKNTHRWNSHEYQNAYDTTIAPRGDQIYECHKDGSASGGGLLP
jgi:hypothetical protein